MKNKCLFKGSAAVSMLLIFFLPAFAQDPGEVNQEELAKKLSNPIASLISVPLQYNYDQGMGLTEDGTMQKLNIQPVIPFGITDNWNLITRTIIPFMKTEDMLIKGDGESGLGDIQSSQFFSPKAPAAGGWIWGLGVVELFPSATDETLGGEKLGIGPTGIILNQFAGFTIGLLINHIRSVAGNDDRDDINQTFIQPFFAYVTSTKTTFGINTESTYDWEEKEWSVPVNFTIAQMLKLGPQIIQIGIGARYWAESPEYAAEGWGCRAWLTFLFPK